MKSQKRKIKYRRYICERDLKPFTESMAEAFEQRVFGDFLCEENNWGKGNVVCVVEEWI